MNRRELLLGVGATVIAVSLPAIPVPAAAPGKALAILGEGGFYLDVETMKLWQRMHGRWEEIADLVRQDAADSWHEEVTK